MAREENSSNKSFTIGTSSVKVAEKCFQKRSCIVITNTSTGGQIISIGIGQEAVAGAGIVLSPGGVYQDSRDGNYYPTTDEINCISNLAAGSVAVHERIITNIGWN